MAVKRWCEPDERTRKLIIAGYPQHGTTTLDDLLTGEIEKIEGAQGGTPPMLGKRPRALWK